MLRHALSPRVRPLLATRLVRGHSIAALALFAAGCGGGGDTGDHGITVPPAPTVSSLLVSSGGSQRARITRTLPQAVVIRAVTAAGVPVTGASLQFTAANGGAVQPASTTTNSSGEATVQWTLGPTAGAQVLTVSATGTSASVTVAATADPALRATVRVLNGDDQQAETGRAVLVAPSVQLLDSAGAPLAGAHLTFTVTAGGGSIQPTAVTTDASGRAATTSWVLGAEGEQTVRIDCTDADLLVQPVVTLAAFAVPVGGTVAMPARNYPIPAGTAPIITDSVTGVQFRVPGGGSGSVTVASAVSGPLLPVEDATRLVVGFSGVARVDVRVVGSSGAPAPAYVYGADHFGVLTHAGTPHWWALPRTAVSADTAWYQLPAVARSNARLWAPSGRAGARLDWEHRQEVVVPRRNPYTFENGRFSALTAKTIAWWRTNLTPTTAAKLIGAEDRLQVSVFGPSALSTDDDAYYRCIKQSEGACTPSIQFPAKRMFDSLHLTAHEPSHYVTQLLVGDARYFGDLEANLPGEGHLPGAIAVGFRNSLIEEYAHFAEFLMRGDVTQFELRSVRASNNGRQFVRNSFSDPGPDRIDYPSIEGFGALMLAAFTRTPSQTVIYDVHGTPSGAASTTKVPTATATDTDLLEILAKGPRNPNELRTALLPLAGSAEKLAAMLEPLGWSYRATGTLVDPAGRQLSGITLASVVRVDGVDYVLHAPTPTDAAGRFTLPRLYPGTSILRAYGPKATDSVDVMSVTADWGAATPTVLTLGLVRLPMNLSALTTFSLTLQGISATNRAGSTSCGTVLTVDGVVNRSDGQGYAMPPLVWKTTRFALDFLQPWAVNQASEQDRGSERVAATGTVVQGLGDTLWFDGRLERSDLRVNTRLAAINAGVKTWATTDSSVWTAVVPIVHLPMLPGTDGVSISGTLRGAEVATALGGWSYDYFSKDLRTEPLHPNFLCNYALTPNAILTVRLAPATLPPP